MTSTTANYHLALISTLQSLSPPLAALHATRYRVLHQVDNISPLHCSRCGALGITTRAVRPRLKRTTKAQRDLTQRVLRRICVACGNIEEQPCPALGAKAFRKAGAAMRSPPQTETSNMVQTPTDVVSPPLHPTPSQSSARASTPTTQISSSAPRRKKKTGLQEMLARKRDQERDKEGQGNNGGGLAAFLSGL